MMIARERTSKQKALLLHHRDGTALGVALGMVRESERGVLILQLCFSYSLPVLATVEATVTIASSPTF